MDVERRSAAPPDNVIIGGLWGWAVGTLLRYAIDAHGYDRLGLFILVGVCSMMLVGYAVAYVAWGNETLNRLTDHQPLDYAEAQQAHDFRLLLDPNHDQSSCWCCCWDCLDLEPTNTDDQEDPHPWLSDL